MRSRSRVVLALLLIVGAPPVHAQRITAVWGSGATDIWALSQQPAVLHFDGHGWSQTPLAGMGTPLAVWGSGPRDVFVVGERGLAMRWDGTQWNRLTTGVTRDLVAVAGRSAGEVYIVAQSESDTDRPLLLRWDGRQFTQVPLTIPFLARGIAVTPTEVVVVGNAMFDPTPGERRSYGVVARMRGSAWSLGGFDGQRATDPALAGAAWRSVCVGTTGTSLGGGRDDGTQAVLVQRAGRWSPLAPPVLPSNADVSEATWVFARDCTPLFLFGQGFARYAAGQWRVMAPSLAEQAARQPAINQEMQALAQQMQAQVQAGRMPTQEQLQRMQQLQEQATGTYQAQAAASASAQAFTFGDGPAGWGMTGTDFWVGTQAGRMVHVTGDSARVGFDPMCLQPGMAGMPQCQGMRTAAPPGAVAPRTTIPQPTRPASKPR